MGAWNSGSFDNDDAIDWLDQLVAADDIGMLRETLNMSKLDYLEAPVAACVLCACEIIVALRGRPSPDLPDIARAWTESHANLDVSSLLRFGIKGIDRVLAEDSELNELWRENAFEYDAWKNNVLSLKARLVAQSS